MTIKPISATLNALPPEPTPYEFRGIFLGDRRGQTCRIIAVNGHTAYIEFEDGFKAHVPRYLMRRKKGVP